MERPQGADRGASTAAASRQFSIGPPAGTTFRVLLKNARPADGAALASGVLASLAPGPATEATGDDDDPDFGRTILSGDDGEPLFVVDGCDDDDEMLVGVYAAPFAPENPRVPWVSGCLLPPLASLVAAIAAGLATAGSPLAGGAAIVTGVFTAVLTLSAAWRGRGPPPPHHCTARGEETRQRAWNLLTEHDRLQLLAESYEPMPLEDVYDSLAWPKDNQPS